MLVLSALVMIFHLAVLAGVVPADIVWGGRTGSRSELVAMETVSLAVNAFLALTVLLRTGRIRSGIPQKWLKGVMWLFMFVFALNTIGNLMAFNRLETWLFTPLTLISSVLCARLAIGE